MKLTERLFSRGAGPGPGTGLKSLIACFLSNDQPLQPAQIRVKSDDTGGGPPPPAAHAVPPPRPSQTGAADGDLYASTDMLRATAELDDDDFSFDLNKESPLPPPDKTPVPRLAAEPRDVPAASSPVPPALASSFARSRRKRQLFAKIATKPVCYCGGAALVFLLAGSAFFLYVSVVQPPLATKPQPATAAAEPPGGPQPTAPESGSGAAQPGPAPVAAAENPAEGTADASRAVLVRQTPARQPDPAEKKQVPDPQTAAPAQKPQDSPPSPQALASAPLPSVDHLLYSASACEQRRDYAAALACYKQAAAMLPAEHRLQNKVGSLLLSLALHADAQPYIAKALELNEHYVPALINMGIVQAKQQNLDAAERYFLSALAQDGTNIDALYNMMLVCRRKGLYTQAARYEEKLKALGRTPQQ